VATTGDYNDLSNQPITVSSISIDGDTLFLSNGETFVNTNSNGLLPTVTTTAATSISANYAYTGGEVTNSGGEYVLARGVCYSTTPNPTIDDQVKSGGSGLGSFTNYIPSLSMGTTYYVRAFATNANGTAYGNEITFTTTTVALVDSLACVSGTLNGTLNAGVVASGVTLTVDYFGGNGGNYSGVSINSTGVTGLTATLTSGQLVNGDGSVVLQISGTPSSTGTAVFVLNLGFGYCVFSTTAICQDGLCYGQSYQGGIIGYLLTPSDSGYDPNTPHGIIVAPTDQSTGAEWGCYGSSVGASGSGFGTGSQNTIDIETGCSTSGTAADICANLTLGGYNDWFLPSIDELEMLFANAANYQGSFGNGYYWSSTEFDLNNAFRFYPTGTWSTNRPKSESYYVRAVRYF
jgi:hypothetical protein